MVCANFCNFKSQTHGVRIKCRSGFSNQLISKRNINIILLFFQYKMKKPSHFIRWYKILIEVGFGSHVVRKQSKQFSWLVIANQSTNQLILIPEIFPSLIIIIRQFEIIINKISHTNEHRMTVSHFKMWLFVAQTTNSRFVMEFVTMCALFSSFLRQNLLKLMEILLLKYLQIEYYPVVWAGVSSHSLFIWLKNPLKSVNWIDV